MGDLNVGIVGLGWVAGAHIETLKAVNGGNVTAICSRREHDEAALEEQFGTPLKAYTDFDEMLANPDIHIIDICTPHPQHAEQAIAAAKAGKHLIIEKPICITWEDAKAMKAAIEEAGVKACVCFEVRFSKHFQLVKSVIDEGLLGEIHFGEIDYYHGIGPWYGQFGWNVKKDFGGSSLLTAGCHALDSLLMCVGSEVEEVTSYETGSKSEIFEPYEYATTSVSILKFKNGALGKCTSCVDCLQPYYFHTHLVGSEGSMLDNRFYSHKLSGMVKDRWSTLETTLIDSGDVSDHPYEPQFQAFVDSINDDSTMPLTDFDTAFESHRVVFAADLSAAEGRPVKLSELE
ncbi:MAG: Gfo/Idh/MocA family oxidoreductase [Planctomycetota bacterium]|jgi:predicted dehydrogenase|nr:Gfo/Idh/MocA family oxidoreductase [Planctomycetota bacterium]MDP7132023.1 Gfo/Idh/MocA family oxidoreductase [Planctomycetota bacterium]MDP7250170.1 Gfo/Idh/MocA family oxidoreductase [Planctomycetota bacterium]